MKRTRDPHTFVVIASLLLILACVETGHALAPIQYNITDLGSLGGVIAVGSDINASGQIVGSSDATGNFEFHAFLYDGTIHDLGTLGGTSSGADDINATGQVTGNADTGNDFDSHAFLYDGTMHDLGTLGGTSSEGFGINDSGQVVGQSSLSDDSRHAFLYDGTMHDLGTLGGDNSFAGDINNSGLVTGSSFTTGNASSHAILYDGTMHDLGSLGGSAGSSIGYAINARGYVVGSSFVSGHDDHAFLYDGTMHDLGTLGGNVSQAFGINSDGRVVGYSTVPVTGASHAFLYTAGAGMVDLNSLIDPHSNWLLVSGRGINDTGQITGDGFVENVFHAYLLTPIPEPSAAALAAVGAIGLAACVRRLQRPHTIEIGSREEG